MSDFEEKSVGSIVVEQAERLPFSKELAVGSRLGPGPVFVYEWLTTTRRWRLYALRAGFVFLILLGLLFISRFDPGTSRTGPFVSLRELARYGQNLFLTVITIEFTIVLLVAPAATAGAICLDKMRGTLDHILATDLSSNEIVLGKLAARLVPVLGLVACVLPLVALTSLLGGIDPTAFFGSFLVAIGCTVLSCSLAMMLSVWGRKTHEVLMMTYLLIILWLFGPYLLRTSLFAMGSSSSFPFLTNAFWESFEATNPYFLGYGPYRRPSSVSLLSYVVFLGCCLGISGIFTSLATWRLRPVAQKHADRTPARKGRGWLGARLPVLPWQRFIPGPTLDGNPVFWREWYRSKPSKAMRLAWGLYAAVGVISIVMELQSLLSSSTSIDDIATLNVFQVGVGLLLLCVSAVTSLADERVHGSLDLLLSTPMSTRSILMAKWGGAFRIIPKLLFARR